jgi:hypothetical protein
MRFSRLAASLLVAASITSLALFAEGGCSSDTFVASDAGSDAATGDGPAADGGAPFCATHPGATICEDFDTEYDAASGLNPNWVPFVFGGALSRSNDAVSSPAALLSSVPASNQAGAALLARDLNLKVARRLQVTMKVQVDPTCGKGLWSVMSFSGDVAGTGVAIGVLTYPLGTGTSLALYSETKSDAGSRKAAAGSVEIVLGQWRELSLDIDFGATLPDGGVGTRTRLTYGGATIIDLTGEAAALASPAFNLGTASESAAGGCTVRYDDVLVTATK